MRDRNIEYLRAIACISVIVLHTNAWTFPDGFSHSILNAWINIGVPLFIMISGGYIFKLADKETTRTFYGKRLKKILVSTFFYSLFYVLFVYFKLFIKESGALSINDLMHPLIDWSKGTPFGHLWYMYMLIGFYGVVPIFVQIRRRVSGIIWLLMGCIFLVGSFIFFNENMIAPIWPLCWIQYVGYFILADFLNNKVGKISNFHSIAVLSICIIGSLLWMIIVSYRSSNPIMFQPQNVFVAIFSISLYELILILKDKIPQIKRLNFIAKYSGDIYFIHAFFLTCIMIVNNKINVSNKAPLVYVIIVSLIVLVLSLIFSIVKEEILKRLHKRKIIQH